MIAAPSTAPRLLERVSRVDRLANRVRRMTLAASALFAWWLVVAGIATFDFLFEASWSIRATALAAGTAGVLAGVCWLWARQSRRRRTTTTAAEIELRFPELGQRTRTAVQYGGRRVDDMHRDGVRPELVAALVEDTAARSDSLPFDEIVPRRKLKITTGMLAGVLVVLALGCLDWEWRRAMSRSLLGDRPYTELSVTPGNITVQTGAAVGITVRLQGRTNRNVVLRFRNAGPDDAAAWTVQSMLADAAADRTPSVAAFGAGIDGIERPQIYRVEAGGIVSPDYTIDVLDPLTIAAVTAEVEYPAYTQLPRRTVTEGAVTALRGSICRFTVELSRAPADVGLGLQPLPATSQAAEEFPDVAWNGSQISFVLPVGRDLLWTLRAQTADGVSLAERPFRLTVTEDRPPKVSFDGPDDGIEVPALAELPMRARISDDYGLTRSGIIFQVSGSEEFTLLEEQFDELIDAAREAETGALTPQTRAVLERLLPLEHFELTQKDSVMYYAFAEDNLPEQPQRTESDRRFIDIRPLLQTFRRRDDDDGGGGGLGGGLASLSELIGRERSILNWTIRTSRAGALNDREVLSYDRLMRSQSEVADLTRALAEGLQARGVDDVDALYQAEAAMLAAVDSLSVGDVEAAVLQEKDAQQYLVEGRNRIDMFISSRGSDSINYQALRDLNRMILQRLRGDRNRDPDAEEAGQLIVTQLMRWARSEEEIAEQLSGVITARTDAPPVPGNAAGAGRPDEERDETGPPSESADATAAPPPDDGQETDAEPESESEEESASAGPATSEPAASVEELEDRQFSILADARELEGLLSDVEGVTDLAKERMTAITTAMAAAADAFESDQLSQARESATDSAWQLRELARQIAGLTQGDVPERISFSRNLAVDLARRERTLSEELQDREDPDSADPAPEIAGVSAEAGDITERSKTLEDLLLAIAQSTDPEAAEAADRVTLVVEERNVSGMREQLEKLLDEARQVDESGAQSESQADTPAAQRLAAEYRDAADDSERLASDLEQIYREVMRPQIERLRDFERSAAELAEQMDEPDNERTAEDLAGNLESLLEELETAEAGGAARDALEELLRNTGRDGLWDIGPDRLRLNDAYRAALAELLQELQRELQELVLADSDFDADTPVPVGFERFVDRYLQVLSRGN